MMDINASVLNLLGEIFGIVIGVCSIVFHKRLGRWVAEFQRKVFHIHVSEVGVRGAQIGYLIIGIIFVLFGIVTLININK